MAQVWSLENWRTPRDLRPAYEQVLGPHGYLHARRISNDEIFVRHPRCPVQGMPRNGQHGASLMAMSHAAHGVSDISHRRADGSGGGKGGEAERSAVQRGSCSRGSRIRAPERCLSKDAVAAVRCCGGAQCYSICWAGQRPYTSSRWELPPRLGTNGLRANWSAAAAECDAHGLRLCSASEFASDQCCRSGCGTWTKEQRGQANTVYYDPRAGERRAKDEGCAVCYAIVQHWTAALLCCPSRYDLVQFGPAPKTHKED